jgi:uncharacterized protein
MSKQIYLNLPVKDLVASTAFYEALGFVKNTQMSDTNGSCMNWSEEIVIMLLTHEFYAKFTKKTIPDLTQTSSCLISLTMDSKDAVQQFADVAKTNGGSYFEAEPNKELDFMFTLEVTDLDGHTLEPFYMDISKFPIN